MAAFAAGAGSALTAEKRMAPYVEVLKEGTYLPLPRMQNTGDAPLTFVSVYVVDKSKPLATPAQAPQ